MATERLNDESHNLLSVSYTPRKKMLGRLCNNTAQALDQFLLRWWQRSQNRFL